jgi:uncharacterized cupin superfamily protein
MYVINEPTPGGFQPHKTIVVRDETQTAPASPLQDNQDILPGASTHTDYIVRELFTPADGLATEQSIATVTLNPGMMSEHHTHRPGREEVWTAIDGTSTAWLGTALRVQKPGMAYMLRPDGVTTHSNINNGDKPVKFLYFVRLPDYAPPVPNLGHP